MQTTRTLKAGTLIHIQGMPVRLTADAEATTDEGNWGLIDEFEVEAALGSDPAAEKPHRIVELRKAQMPSWAEAGADRLIHP